MPWSACCSRITLATADRRSRAPAAPGLADRLAAVTTASGQATTFTIHALGRHGSRTVGTTTPESYSYLGSSDTVIGITSGAGTTTSAIDAVGNRVATAGGGSFGFLLPDLHGNTAGALNAAATTITDAFAYDAYGLTVAAVTSALPTPWRYQGRILESAAGTPDLYDFGARSYNPTLGTFTSLDSKHGSAGNPALLNGYLYANANPATLVDPDGHCAIAPSNRDEAMWCAAHADTTYGQAGPTGRTPSDDVANSSRSSRTTSSPTPYGPPAPLQKLTLGNGVGLMKPNCDNLVCGLQNNVGGAVDTAGRAAVGKVSDLAGGVGNKAIDLAGGLGNAWADTGGAAVNWVHDNPAITATALILAGTGAACIAGGLETLGAACLAFIGALGSGGGDAVLQYQTKGTVDPTELSVFTAGGALMGPSVAGMSLTKAATFIAVNTASTQAASDLLSGQRTSAYDYLEGSFLGSLGAPLEGVKAVGYPTISGLVQWTIDQLRQK